MDENSFKTLKETVDFYEDKMQELYKKDVAKQKQIDALEGKIKGYINTIKDQKDELKRLRPKKKQHFRNQTSGVKGSVRR